MSPYACKQSYNSSYLLQSSSVKVSGVKKGRSCAQFLESYLDFKNGDPVVIVFTVVKLLFDHYDDLEPPNMCLDCDHLMLFPV